MKIVMVGPVYPYKGGIAHYTGMLSRALAKSHQVTNLSYSMQYPRFLYKREQKDFSDDFFKVDNPQFIINTANPFSWVATARTINRLKPDVVVVQWWHPYFAPFNWALSGLLRKNIRLVYICHNVLPHENFPAKRFVAKMALKRADKCVVHTSMDAGDLAKILPKVPYVKAMHPTYNTFKQKNLSRPQAREEIGLTDTDEVLLFFGYIREYKGLRHLLAALPEIVAERPNAKLLIVGDFFEGTKDEYLGLIKATGCEENITLVDGYVPDSAVEKYFAACDIVVLPYESATQSGIVQIAYGFEKPVLATDVGGLPEVVLDGETGYIIPPKNTKMLAEKVVEYFTENKEPQFVENIRRESYKYEWERLVEIIEAT